MFVLNKERIVDWPVTIPPGAVFTVADVKFMQGMIAHHAQALLMAGWAESHGASPAIRTLTQRIINAQNDEIVGGDRLRGT